MDDENLSKLSKYDSNPYIKGVLTFIKDKNTKVATYKVPDPNNLLLDVPTGELKPVYNVIHTKNKVDVQQYNKLYVTGISKLFDLTKPEQKVLKYIFSKLEKDKDWIYFSIKDCKQDCEYTSNQIVHLAISGLIKKEIIARTLESHKLWINPTIMFNGDRMIVINEYIKSNDIVNKIDKE